MDRPKSLFNSQPQGRAVRLNIGRVDNDCLGRGTGTGQALYHAQEPATLVPTLPQAVEGLERFVLLGRIAPKHPSHGLRRQCRLTPSNRELGSLPRLSEKYGASRAICSSVRKYRLLIGCLLAEPGSDRLSHINES